jgi:hypothetical protein
MARLDETMPYSEVYGIPGVAFEQSGAFFTVAGREVRDGVVLPLEVDPEPPAGAVASEYRGMHWKHLKALVESYDHEWVSKDDAVAFLEGQGMESEAVA